MPTTAILAAQTAAGTSTSVTVTAAAPATITAFVASGNVDSDVQLTVEKQNSGTTWNSANQSVGGRGLSGGRGNPILIEAPGVYRIQKPVTTQAVGIDLDQ